MAVSLYDSNQTKILYDFLNKNKNEPYFTKADDSKLKNIKGYKLRGADLMTYEFSDGTFESAMMVGSLRKISKIEKKLKIKGSLA